MIMFGETLKFKIRANKNNQDEDKINDGIIVFYILFLATLPTISLISWMDEVSNEKAILYV